MWLQRVTHEVLDILQKLSIPDWVEEQARRKWRWTGHVCRRTDGRWSRRALDCAPVGSRARGHPPARWRDSIYRFVSQAFGAADVDVAALCSLAQDREAWSNLQEDYVNFVVSAR